MLGTGQVPTGATVPGPFHHFGVPLTWEPFLGGGGGQEKTFFSDYGDRALFKTSPGLPGPLNGPAHTKTKNSKCKQFVFNGNICKLRPRTTATTWPQPDATYPNPWRDELETIMAVQLWRSPFTVRSMQTQLQLNSFMLVINTSMWVPHYDSIQPSPDFTMPVYWLSKTVGSESVASVYCYNPSQLWHKSWLHNRVSNIFDMSKMLTTRTYYCCITVWLGTKFGSHSKDLTGFQSGAVEWLGSQSGKFSLH